MLSPGPISGAAASRPDARIARLLLGVALALFAIAAATILGALAFEHIGGYLPCHLCLMQRTPYYIGVPVAAAAIIAIWVRAPRAVLVVLLVVFAALMLYNTGLAAYHSGVEWGLWTGPASCAPSISVDSAADMLNQLEEHAPNCTEAALRIFGLSLAGWNAVISALLTLLGVAAARMAWRRG